MPMGLQGPAERRDATVFAVLVAILGASILLFVLAGRLQDDGWYVYAARRALQGSLPYRDAPFPHPPVALLPYLPAAALPGWWAVLAGRLIAAGLHLVALALAISALPAPRDRTHGRLLVLLLLVLDPFAICVMTQIRSYPVASLSLAGVLSTLALGRPWAAGLCLGIGAGARLSLLAAVPALLVAASMRPGWMRQTAAGLALGLGLVLMIGWSLGGSALAEQLYVPWVGLPAPNAMTRLYLEGEVPGGVLAWSCLALASLIRLVWTHLPVALALAASLRARPLMGPIERFAGISILSIGGIHLLARRPYDDYQIVLLPAVVFLIVRGCRAWLSDLGGLRTVGFAALLVAIPGMVRSWNHLHLRPRTALGDLAHAGRLLESDLRAGERLLTLDTHLLVAGNRVAVPGLELGRFGVRPDQDSARSSAGGVAFDELVRRIRCGDDPLLALPLPDGGSLDRSDELVAAAAERYRPLALLAGFGERRQPMVIWELDPETANAPARPTD